jgi:hypothetical protein
MVHSSARAGPERWKLPRAKGALFRALVQRGRTGPCAQSRPGYRPPAMPEPGLVTLVKIVGTLLGAMSVVPFLFLFAPGDRKEPTETFDGDVQ